MGCHSRHASHGGIKQTMDDHMKLDGMLSVDVDYLHADGID